jgi:hypothetical protein
MAFASRPLRALALEEEEEPKVLVEMEELHGQEPHQEVKQDFWAKVAKEDIGKRHLVAAVAVDIMVAVAAEMMVVAQGLTAAGEAVAALHLFLLEEHVLQVVIQIMAMLPLLFQILRARPLQIQGRIVLGKPFNLIHQVVEHIVGLGQITSLPHCKTQRFPTYLFQM